jgi:hypothetical protein
MEFPGGWKFNVSAQIFGENFCPMYCKVHHFVKVQGCKKFCKGNKGFHPLEEFYHMHKESPVISTSTKVKQRG